MATPVLSLAPCPCAQLSGVGASRSWDWWRYWGCGAQSGACLTDCCVALGMCCGACVMLASGLLAVPWLLRCCGPLSLGTSYIGGVA